jgi:nucleotide-binding universal stress UspA family protein
MNCFERILVPVDFTINTDVAVKKAIQLATPGSTVLYLLHIKQPHIFNRVFPPPAQQKDTSCFHLLKWEQRIRKMQPELDVVTEVSQHENIEKAIISFADKIKASLVIIGKKSRHSFLPFLNTVISSNITAACGCPVLTAKPGSIEQGVSSIVMPVTELFPTRKMDLLSALNTRASLQVHLLYILNEDQLTNEQTASALLLCMRFIRNRFNCSVQHQLIHSNNKAMAILRYAEKINADMLLVNLETETAIDNWISKKDITDILRPASQLQVLRVQSHLKN